MKLKEINKPITPEAQDTSIAQNQLLKIGSHAILLNNIINSQETDPWVAKKINLASNHVKKVHNYMAEYRQTVSPRDEAHYREMMKTLHDLELKSARDPETMAEIKRRKMELRNWAEQNIKRTEGFIGKKIQYNDFLQTGLGITVQEYVTPEKKAERDALMKKYFAKGGKIQKVPTGQTAYKGKELKPAFKKDGTVTAGNASGINDGAAAVCLMTAEMAKKK